MYVRPLRTTNGLSWWAAASWLDGGSVEIMVRPLAVVTPPTLVTLSERGRPTGPGPGGLDPGSYMAAAA